MTETKLETTKEVQAAEKPWWRRLLSFLLEMVIIIVVVVLIRSFVISPFVIEGSSMVPNLHNADIVLVDKISARLMPYQRGDVIVFVPPVPGTAPVEGILCWGRKLVMPILGVPFEDACRTKLRYVKRIIGTAGDVIEIRDGQVWLTPAEGGDSQLINEQFLAKSNQTETCFTPNCRSRADREGKLFEVPENAIFVLGDNRRSSSDSRSFVHYGASSAFVPLEQVTGRVRLIFWPFSDFNFHFKQDILVAKQVTKTEKKEIPKEVTKEAQQAKETKAKAPSMLKRMFSPQF